ncbi:MAG: DNA primase [Petrimonas sp.]|jgi:DNA primase|uniref:DNA primase n=1 Tax=Petrimonas sp. TaxID=2023866 RepID=UPI000E87F414|nr:DNA primase [Petrimonas sp.]HBF96081.1 DNA primase [Porphyromonadaceae bacterium]MDD4015567.1 DNA primase [Petrimonas sp.]MDD4536726.1 DNA primase [Petrimonas sp.]MDD4846295.1 DNA primase [Petrimonas sp.]
MIDSQTIERIQDTAQIVDVVSDFVTLRRRGVNFVGLCPFHDDRTPSFYVSPAKNICKCFACGEGGSSVHFIMKHEQLSYYEALKFLAKKYNIEVVEKELTSEEKQAQSDRDSMFILNEFARDYFVKKLHDDPEGKAIGLSYFKERGFRDDIIKKFQLGYSLEQRDAFSSEAQRAGYRSDYLLKTGLSAGGENNSPLIDRFRGRVIFPVHTLSGKVVAFGGRILKKAENTGKYVNSPESEIYSKSRELYGIFFSKSAIVKADKCFLVEGYTDVLSMHQAGIENVVASSGTALTHGQIRMIHRFSENITVLYDGDAAGIKAALRGIDLLLEDGMNVRVVLLPEGEDPDSFARKQSAEEFNRFIEEHEQDFIRFKTHLLLDEVGDDPIKKAGLITNIVQSIALIPDNIKRSVYIQDTATLLSTREDVVIAAVNKIRIRNYEKKKEQHEKEESRETAVGTASLPGDTADNGSRKILTARNPYEKPERELIRYIIRYGTLPIFVRYEKEKQKVEDEEIEVEVTIEDGPSVIEVIRFDLMRDKFIFSSEAFFSNTLYRAIFDEACGKVSDESFVCDRYFLTHHDPGISKLATDLISDKYQLSKIHAKSIGESEDEKSSRLRERNSLDKLVIRATTELKNAHVMQRINEVKKNIETADAQQQMELMNELRQLQDLKKVLAKNLGERIILRY